MSCVLAVVSLRIGRRNFTVGWEEGNCAGKELAEGGFQPLHRRGPGVFSMLSSVSSGQNAYNSNVIICPSSSYLLHCLLGGKNQENNAFYLHWDRLDPYY